MSMPSRRPIYVLGINAFHGDASAVLLRDGQLVAAVEEERFKRIKHCAGFPSEAIRSVLDIAGIHGRDVDHVGVSRNPRAHLLRKVRYALHSLPSPRMIADRAQNASRFLNLRHVVREALGEGAHARVHLVEHHPSHLASSFFVSPFDDAACCAIDGFGDFVSTSFALGQGNRIRVLDRVYYPHSVGLVYTAVTQYLGFNGYGDEFKVMGLAPYGEPEFLPEMRRLVRLLPGGKFELDLSYFRHSSDGILMQWSSGYPNLGRVYSDELVRLLGPAREENAPLARREENIAASVQALYEECAIHILNGLWERTKNPRLCLAGGCAMNSVMNGEIRSRTNFSDVYIQPAAADNGTALGAAYWVWHQILGNKRCFTMEHGYWGPKHDETAAVNQLRAKGGGNGNGSYDVERLDSAEDVARRTAQHLADGAVVGWYQDRMEWGARALGNRSIVADPRRSDIRDLINTKIKFRERFRPFAPAIAEEALNEYFVDAVPDPFMLQVYPVREDRRSVIPAVTHVDGSGRLQTVSEQTNPTFYRLIKEFENITGVPVVLNTSFNENEPIVNTPEQALDCFLRTKMDVIVLNNTIIRRRPGNGSGD
jgi:carbamoyltransferase